MNAPCPPCPRSVPSVAKSETGSVIEIVPHERGGYGLRIAGDDVICGHYATVEDARRHADPTFQHVVVCEEAAS